MIYLIVGKSCSGKTEAREYLEKQLNIPGFEASSFFHQAAIEHQISIAKDLYAIEGRDFVARRIQSNLQKEVDALISGFRTPEEIEYMQQFNDCTVVGIYASDVTCFLRSQKRGRTDNYPTFLDFYVKKICDDYALGLAKIIANKLDYIVD